MKGWWARCGITGGYRTRKDVCLRRKRRKDPKKAPDAIGSSGKKGEKRPVSKYNEIKGAELT